MRGKHYAESHAILTFYFNVEREAMAAGDVAKAIGVPYTTFMKWVAGEHACPTEKMVKIYEVTNYAPLLQVLTPAGIKFEYEDGATPDKETVEEEIMDVICSSTKACTKWRVIMGDGRVTRREAVGMVSFLETVKREVDEAISLVRQSITPEKERKC